MSCASIIDNVLTGLVKDIKVDPDYQDDPTTTVLFWTVVNRYNGVFVFDEWHETENYIRTPLVTMPAGEATFNIEILFERSRMMRGQFTYNFIEGREYFVTWAIEDKPLDGSGRQIYNCVLKIYNTLPNNKKYDFQRASLRNRGFPGTNQGRAMQSNLIESIVLFEIDWL